MSHSSGILASKDLISEFSLANQGNTRFIKVIIKDDQLVSDKIVESKNDFEQDLDLITELLDKTTPCYILYKTDDKSVELRGNNWIFMLYVPDLAKVRDKMTYASTKSNLKRELGSSHFVDEIYSSNPNDFSKKGYKQHKVHQESSAPLTWEEQQRADEREAGLFVGGGGMYVHGVAFPIEEKAVNAINQYQSGQVNYVQLAINITDEKIIFSESSNISADDLSSKVPLDEPRFHFFKYSHQFEGSNLNSNVFIFSCPDGSSGTKSAPVRMRMLYSSSKANVESLLTRNEEKVDLKLEINAPSEVSESIINSELHPQKQEEKKAFSKPTRPGAGSRKLIK
eukprot:gene2442-3015_t